jgi:hypothetical protein
MKIIRRIITIHFLFILFLIPTAYAQYPTSTPETMAPMNFNFTEDINDAPLDGSSTIRSQAGGRSENMASGSSAMRSVPTDTWTGGGDDNLSSTADNW